MAQDAKVRISLDDQLTKELEILLKNLADPVGKILGMLGTVAETAKTASGGIVKGFAEVSDAVHKSGEERKKQTESIVNETTTAGEKIAKEEKKQNEERAKSFNELYLEIMKGEKESKAYYAQEIVKALEKSTNAFRSHFHDVLNEFGDFSGQLVSGTDILIKDVERYPKAFSDGFLVGFKKITTEAGASFGRINKLGIETATDLNTAFSKYFVSMFQGHTVSLSSMWGAFTETLKNKFFSAMAENARDSLTQSLWFMIKLVLVA